MIWASYTAFETLLPHLKQVDLPLALRNHATPNGCLLAESITNQLKQAKLTHIPWHDLGLTPAQGLALALPAEPSPSDGNPTALARYLDADEVSFLVEQRQQISLFSLTIERLTRWLEERFVTVGLAPKLMPHEEQLRATALTTMKKTLTDWALHRFYSITHADFLADQVIQFLSNDLHIEQMPRQLQENLHSQPQQAWRALWNELTTKRCEAIIEHRQEQLNQLILAYKEQLADKEP